MILDDKNSSKMDSNKQQTLDKSDKFYVITAREKLEAKGMSSRFWLPPCTDKKD